MKIAAVRAIHVPAARALECPNLLIVIGAGKSRPREQLLPVPIYIARSNGVSHAVNMTGSV
jgi:hypothetical protein